MKNITLSVIYNYNILHIFLLLCQIKNYSHTIIEQNHYFRRMVAMLLFLSSATWQCW